MSPSGTGTPTAAPSRDPQTFVRLGLALLSGLALWVSFPTFSFWPAAVLGMAGFAAVTTGVGVRRGALLGFLVGLACFLPTLSWSGIFVGSLPWVALCVLQSGYLAGVGAMAALMQRDGRIRPLAVAGVWTAGELARSTTPWGGFPWARLAMGQADSPFGRVAALAGVPGVGFAVALTGALVALALATAYRRGPAWRVAWPMMAAATLLGAPLTIALPTAGESANVLAVQGNVPKAGLDFNDQRRAVLDNHVRVTRAARDDIAAGRIAHPDIVVWPENASDIDPTRNPDAAALISAVARELAAPLVVGGLLEEPVDHVSNGSLLYSPQGQLTDRYIKRHPVPFAEYIPWRPFVRLFSDKVDYVARDFVAGDRLVVFDVPRAGGGQVRAAPSICFEVAYDDLVRDGVQAGATLLLVQTNNATFGFTAESEQQLAYSRLRAMEHGRSVVHISTVGVSALITPDGQAHQMTSLYTPAALTGALPLRTETTLATRIGQWPEILVVALTVLAAAASAWGARRERRRLTQVHPERLA